ncbi:MAG TPA: hypothetical protein VJ647_00830 [Chitinophagaceae bacterium]|nr:hypothetical protein [Chitinophagaceae bacterium]
MNNPFSIEFDLNLEHTSITIRLQAVARQTGSSFYRVHSFRDPSRPVGIATCLLPDQEIKCLDRDGHKSWVHLDSEKETALSMAIGKAIESRNSGV